MSVSVAGFIGVPIASASRTICNVSEVIATLYPQYVRLEDSTQEEFYHIAGFPKVHGVIDCTHIMIQSPAQCENGLLGNGWLIRDSGYPCKPYFLTPLLNPTIPSEQVYNEAHTRTRNTIERCFGVWKRRFPVLSLKITLKLQNTQSVLIATAVLHNLYRKHNLEDVAPEVDVLEVCRIEPIIPTHHESDAQRQYLINNYFGR